MKALFQLLILSVAIGVSAQPLKTDSVEKALKGKLPDTVRVKMLSYQSENAPDGVWEDYTYQLIEFAENKLAKESNPQLQHFYSHYLAPAYNNAGLDKRNKGEITKAIEYYDKSLRVAEKMNDKSQISVVLLNTGRILNQYGQISAALENFHQALALQYAIGDSVNIPYSLNFIGDIYRNQNELVQAIKNYHESLTIQLAIHDTLGTAETYNRIGMTEGLMNNPSSAIENHQKAIAVYEKYGLKRGVITSLNNLGAFAHKQRKYQEALQYMERAHKLLETTKEKNMLTTNLSGQGLIYFEMRDFKKAELYFLQSLELAKQINSPRSILTAAKGLYQVYKQNHKLERALAMHELYTQMSDSISNEDTHKAALKSQLQYDYAKKRFSDSLKMVAQQQVTTEQLSKARTQRYLFILGILLVGMVAGVLLYRSRLNNKLHQLELRNKIARDLHDEVGSALTSISIFAEVAQSNQPKTMSHLKMIGETCRDTIQNMNDIIWVVNPQNDSFEKIVQRMKNLAQNVCESRQIALNFNLQTGTRKIDLPMTKRKNFYLIFKEAINNAIKYSEASLISIMIRNENANLLLEVKDNGIGFDQELAIGNGIGNMKKRAQEMNADLTISSQQSLGTHILLILKPTQFGS